MTREEKISSLKNILSEINENENAVCYLTSEDNELIESAIEALEQEPCEDEYIKVPKKALKYRTAGMVAYNAEWLKNHFDIERSVICGAQEPCEDAISRKWLVEALEAKGFSLTDTDYNIMIHLIRDTAPSVQPKLKGGHI